MQPSPRAPHRLAGRSDVDLAPPLIKATSCPVSIAQLDRAWAKVEEAAFAGDERRKKLALDVYSAASLVHDRWAVRSGPAPFITFVKLVMPDLIIGPHHWALGRAFERLARRELLRLMVFMPPGHSKSLFASILLPAWLFGLNPEGRILAASHGSDFARDFGRSVRDLIATPAYRRLFPVTRLSKDVAAADDWRTDRGGKYQCIGVGTAAAGRRADMLGLIDDPISEQDAFSETRRERVKTWWPSFRNRMMPRTPMCIMMTRWHVDDLAGGLLKTMRERPGSEQWEVLRVPAELDKTAVGIINAAIPPTMKPVEVGQAPFEELWSKRELDGLKELFPPYYWSALYMQDPTVDGGGIYRREWWRAWPSDQPLPEISYLMQVWDTAYEEAAENDPSACLTWGAFEIPPEKRSTGRAKPRTGLMMLGRYRKRVDFPTLREDAYQEFARWNEGPCGPVDLVLIEPKASGKSLIQEMHRKGVIAMPWNPERGGQGAELSKIASAHAASVVLYGGVIWYPAGRRWAEEVIQECVEFPSGEHDDQQDCCKIAWLWARRNQMLVIMGDAVERPAEENAERLAARRARAAGLGAVA